ncbi:MAG: TolC family protein [candidate division Zixibacteria bacterium]|nr:TolC family protein [candidate division Zixibacteria bacterium]
MTLRRFAISFALIASLGVSITSCASSPQSAARADLKFRAHAFDDEEPAQAEDATSDDPLANADSLTLATALALAAGANTGLKSAFYRWKASVESIAPAGALPDPNLNFGYFIESVETRVGPQQFRVGLSQMFPWFGTLKLKGDMAAYDAQAAEQQFEAVRDRLYRDVVVAYVDYYFVQQSIAITEENLRLVANAEAVARARYRAGNGVYANVLRAQTELARFENDVMSLTDKLRPVRARLNELLDRPSGDKLPPAASLPNDTLEWTDDELLSRVREMNPNVRRASWLTEKAQASEQLAGRRFYPNLMLGVDYLSTGEARMPGVTESGKDAIIGMVGINIPIWFGAYKSDQREATAHRRAAEYALDARVNAIITETEDALYAYRDAERQVELYNSALLPKAAEALAATQTSYEAGSVTFIDFLDAQETLLDFSLAYERAHANRLKELARLRMLAGGALETAVND